MIFSSETPGAAPLARRKWRKAAMQMDSFSGKQLLALIRESAAALA
jgi:hypothetical protein